MKIVVLADTHSRMLPGQVAHDLSQCDLIIHAGDICDENMLQEIENLNDVEAVYGNMDNSVLRDRLPQRLVLRCEGVRIGVVHGDGAPDQLLDHIQEEFEAEDVDVVIFGHSHEPMNKKIGERLFFNPGSPNDNIFAPYCSYGILEIDGNHIKADIIKVK